ncbi:alpha/beta-hydrolase [Pseudovirgaria hyperparasitica]|uniref:Alpha/beta-hydrolase n=1 Tax=Pseudovirgaria hyperparasitica TaxID=470096 RepID=A0A6A6WM39_9PEZI|nr:alpha/beta-hydrolase [Pseudovirgaria hyperparasitica]KAF2763280.1 alpha/beta-hydrolase [Pseudovirgaria hyperparasitica]
MYALAPSRQLSSVSLVDFSRHVDATAEVPALPLITVRPPLKPRNSRLSRAIFNAFLPSVVRVAHRCGCAGVLEFDVSIFEDDELARDVDYSSGEDDDSPSIPSTPTCLVESVQDVLKHTDRDVSTATTLEDYDATISAPDFLDTIGDYQATPENAPFLFYPFPSSALNMHSAPVSPCLTPSLSRTSSPLSSVPPSPRLSRPVPPFPSTSSSRATLTVPTAIPRSRSSPSLNTTNPLSVTDNTRASTAKHIYDKVWRYQNSRLPPDMPPCEIPIACWPLINLAAKYSEKVYTDPQARAEKKMYVSAGAKPMFMKSVTRDDQKVVILAIRGTKRFKDWCVNFRDRGVDPKGFLDDPTQKCHAGFLDVAKSMIKPIAEHLDHLLAEDPSRSRCSLLLTGHSAGGAVASLLYAHLASSAAISPFHTLMRKFKRVHCVTFGTPPCTLFPLAKPEGEEWVRSIFVTFVNEGDPVPRADRSVLGSLLDLYRQPAPKIGSTIQWRVPPGEMNLPGSLVVMRTKPGSGGPVLSVVNVEAISARNQDLRTVMYGDPLAHQMVLYQKRVQELATRSATARDD